MGRPEVFARPPLASAMALPLLVLWLLSAGVSGRLTQPLPRVFLSFEGLNRARLRSSDTPEPPPPPPALIMLHFYSTSARTPPLVMRDFVRLRSHDSLLKDVYPVARGFQDIHINCRDPSDPELLQTSPRSERLTDSKTPDLLSAGDLQASQSFEHYSISDKAMDYRILQMDEDQDRMYVGCKDHVLSVDINNITHGTLKVSWPASTSKIEECQMAGKDPTHGCGNFIRVVQPYNRTHLFMCGSGAYSPVCVYVNRGRRPEEQVFHIDSRTESGKGRCSFNPQVNTVSVMLNQELFSGMYIDFMGTDAAIFRSLTRRNAVRTDQHNSKWLSEPIFIDAHLIPDGTDPNDAKLYFFFRERLTDNNGNTKNIHTMVARVCPSDIGGQRSLVNKWTTFLKARMVCSVLEEDGTETHFDELENVFLLETDQPKSLLVFGVFTSTSSVFKGSAVCVYNMADILTVFNGPFAHRDGPNFQWVAFQGRIPYPRPGTCPGGAFTPDIQTTKEFPDDVVTFVRNHPVMFNPIYPVGRRPLVVRTNADYKYTSVAVDQVMASDGNYQVLFLGTDRGTIQKVIVLPTNHSLHEDLILEELEVFKNQAPVTNLRISPKKQQLYVSSEFGVSQVSLHRCHAYGSACADCCLARDPYCAWDGLSCSRFYPTSKSVF
ncbi:hypothetical protein F2P81_019049 [Scophthalmus maximus]|uniref:Sema domain-containing protein n=1 Tax=Scophthalmus maximus TaxID=52904 RepID=A0A6A4SG96_SCOMX|nr:hypothetical protein F2P81_019049 [Scophthalmus maximus]